MLQYWWWPAQFPAIAGGPAHQYPITAVSTLLQWESVWIEPVVGIYPHPYLALVTENNWNPIFLAADLKLTYFFLREPERKFWLYLDMILTIFLLELSQRSLCTQWLAMFSLRKTPWFWVMVSSDWLIGQVLALEEEGPAGHFLSGPSPIRITYSCVIEVKTFYYYKLFIIWNYFTLFESLIL